jgi:hypothetical protein
MKSSRLPNACRRVAKALLGKAAVPDDLPFVTGSIGLLGDEAELGSHEGL